MNFFDNHRNLFLTATLFFVVLTIFVAVIPALHNQVVNAPLPSAVPLSEDAIRGKALYVSHGCVACHTQQVRNLDMDKMWGSRPSMAADYAGTGRTDVWRNTATLTGRARADPALAHRGDRQPSQDWHLVHLCHPRIVVQESVMSAYPFVFEFKQNPGEKDVLVSVPEQYAPNDGSKIVA